MTNYSIKTIYGELLEVHGDMHTEYDKRNANIQLTVYKVNEDGSKSCMFFGIVNSFEVR